MKNRKIILRSTLLLFFITLTLGSYYSGKFRTTSANESLGQVQGEEVIRQVSEDVPKEYYLRENIKESVQVPVQMTTATIIATGDIMFHTPQVKSAYNKDDDRYYFDDVFKYVKKYIQEADVAIGNFETVTAGSEHRFRGFPRFNTPNEIVEAIKNTGFDILTTANNHSIDMGKEGIIETIGNINNNGLQNIGTYKEPTEDILVRDINGIKIGFISYTYGCNGLEYLLTEEELEYMVNIIDEEKIKEDIKKAESQGSDIVVMFIHWGNEYQRKTSLVQEDLGNKMIEWGADIILGSHPHVIQKSEVTEYEGEDKFIIYSMGNFISNQRRETLENRNRKYTEDGIMVKIEIEKDIQEDKVTIKDIEFIPTWVNRFIADGKFKYEILPVNDFINNNTEELSIEVMNKLKGSYQNTMDLMYIEDNQDQD